MRNLGNINLDLGRLESALQYFEESLALAHRSHDRLGIAGALNNAGIVYIALKEAQYNYATSLRLAREIGKKQSIGYALSNLGLVACDLGNWAEAERCFRESVQTALDAYAPPRALDALGGWAILLARTSKLEQAAELLGLVRSHPATEHEALDRAQALMIDLQAALPADTLKAALQRGATTNWEDLARRWLAKPSTI